MSRWTMIAQRSYIQTGTARKVVNHPAMRLPPFGERFAGALEWADAVGCFKAIRREITRDRHGRELVVENVVVIPPDDSRRHDLMERLR